MPNGLTYTEAVLEFTQMLTASENRQTIHNTEVLKQLARGDEKFKAIYDKMDGEGGINERIGKAEDRIDNHDDDFIDVRDKVRTIGRIEAALAIVAGALGIDRLA